MLDMATFKEFFLVYRDSGLEHAHHSDFYGASAECANHGGAIAFPATNEHMAELVRLLAESDDAQGSVVLCAESGRLNQGLPFGDCLLLSALLRRASSAAGYAVEQ